MTPARTSRIRPRLSPGLLLTSLLRVLVFGGVTRGVAVAASTLPVGVGVGVGVAVGVGVGVGVGGLVGGVEAVTVAVSFVGWV